MKMKDSIFKIYFVLFRGTASVDWQGFNNVNIQMDMKDKCPLNLHLMSPSHLSKLLVTTVFFTGDLVCLV